MELLQPRMMLGLQQGCAVAGAGLMLFPGLPGRQLLDLQPDPSLSLRAGQTGCDMSPGLTLNK